jgi:hypothetical protein
VPTANGRLSFRHVGESRNPTDARYANVTTESIRLVLAFQHRPLSDILFQRILHMALDLDGSFYFALSAQSIGVPGETDELRGLIYIYKSKADWKEKGRPSIRERVNAINSLLNSLDPDRMAKMAFLFQEADVDLKRTADVSINFRLFRNGEVYFCQPEFQDKQLEGASTEYAAARGHDFLKWIADQGYFFLRDITHRHQHHTPSSDTILILQYRLTDDVRWRRNIIYSLYHYIIQAKRFNNTASLLQAIGIVAYCKSFKGICTERFRDGLPGLPNFNDEALLISLKARADEWTAQANDRATDAMIRISRAANWRLFALAFAGVLTAVLVMFVQPLIEKGGNTKLRAMSDFAADNAVSAMAAIILFLLFVWALTQSDWQIKTQVGRDILEFSNVRKLLLISAYAVAGVVVIVIAGFLAEPAISDLKHTFAAFLALLSKLR